MPQNRVPTVLKLARNNPGKRAINKDEPKPELSPIEPPEEFGLSDMAKEQWANVAPHLINSGLLTVLDRPALVLYCESCARWIDANDKVKKHGAVVKAPSGFPVQSPYLAIANKAFDQMKSILTEFGMTPASRTKVTSAKPDGEEHDPYSDL